MEKIKQVFSFLTIFPAGVEKEIEKVAGAFYLFPLAGALLGFAAGFLAMLFSRFFSSVTISALSLFLLLFFQGFLHFDGFLDFADAALMSGSSEKRIKALHDKQIGAFAFAAGVFIIVLSILFIEEALPAFGYNLAFLLCLSEANAKLSIIFLAQISKPLNAGIGKVFIAEAKKNKRHIFISSSIFAFLSAVLRITPAQFFALISASLLVAFLLKLISERKFYGVNGDVLGACNEITRLASLIFISLLK